ncbi:MAG: hypothetical protein K2Q20_10990 [Phycisphaerales bacterium]|nr:hypothetical protein [Phycisphaerales bacterium]
MLEPTPTPASEFGEHIDEHLRRLTRSKSPTLLTNRGKVAAWVLSPAQYRAYSKDLEELKTLRAVNEGRNQIASGQGLSMAELDAGIARIKAKRRGRR